MKVAVAKGLISWIAKIFLQNVRYRHKKTNIKIPKYKLAYKDSYHEIFLSVISKKYIPPK